MQKNELSNSNVDILTLKGPFVIIKIKYFHTKRRYIEKPY